MKIEACNKRKGGFTRNVSFLNVNDMNFIENIREDPLD